MSSFLSSRRWVAPAIALAAICAAAPAQQAAPQASVFKMGVEQKLGSQVPAGAIVRDADGNRIQLGSLFGRRPIIFLPIFYNCQSACGREVENLLKVLVRIKDRSAGKDYDVVFFSIHPKETPELAKAKQNVAVEIYDRPGADKGFHFLTSDWQNITAVTDSLGFKFEYDAATNRINHATSIMVLTPSGRVSQYFSGIDYVQPAVLSAIDLAAENKLGRKGELQLLGCVMIDPITRKKSIVIENVIRLIAATFAVGLFSWIGVMSYRHRRSPNPEDDIASETEGGQAGA